MEGIRGLRKDVFAMDDLVGPSQSSITFCAPSRNFLTNATVKFGSVHDCLIHSREPLAAQEAVFWLRETVFFQNRKDPFRIRKRIVVSFLVRRFTESVFK
jgi:hypothetical protein